MWAPIYVYLNEWFKERISLAGGLIFAGAACKISISTLFYELLILRSFLTSRWIYLSAHNCIFDYFLGVPVESTDIRGGHSFIWRCRIARNRGAGTDYSTIAGGQDAPSQLGFSLRSDLLRCCESRSTRLLLCVLILVSYLGLSRDSYRSYFYKEGHIPLYQSTYRPTPLLSPLPLDQA